MNWKCGYCTSLNDQIEKHCTQCNAPKQMNKQSIIKLKSEAITRILEVMKVVVE